MMNGVNKNEKVLENGQSSKFIIEKFSKNR